MKNLRIAVIGGGLAGLAAALECADAGASVSLFESRPRLGGATFSVRRNGYWLDNGQHVALRCCTSYRHFLRRLGVERHLALQPRLRIPVLAPHGRSAVIDRTALPAPLHLSATLLRYHHLPLRDRLAAVRAVTALVALDPDDPQLDGESFGAWLRARGQSDRSVAALWNLIALPTLNLPADEASLLLAVKVFRTGLLDESDACDLALPTVPLQHLHGDPAAAALAERGVQVRLRARVQRIVPLQPGFLVEAGEGSATVDAVVVAVPHDAAPGLLPEGVLQLANVEALGSSPIVNIHVHYDRRVLSEPLAAAVDSPVQWLFDRTAPAGLDHGQLVSVSLSGARRELPLGKDELVGVYRRELERLLPAARGATVLDAQVTKEPRATFRGVPGTRAARPGPRTAIRGLFLAGAWTDTGWPATMEGAVRSGLAAARAALSEPAPRRTAERDGRGSLEAVR